MTNVAEHLLPAGSPSPHERGAALALPHHAQAGGRLFYHRLTRAAEYALLLVVAGPQGAAVV